MLNNRLDELEAKINRLEKQIEEDDEFVDTDEFPSMYNEIIDLYREIKECEIDSFPFEKVNMEREMQFHKQNMRFKKLEKRVTRIQRDSELEGYLSSDWMFDRDEDEQGDDF